MKKLILTFFTIALVAGMAMAQADNNDTGSDLHTVTIKIPRIAILDIEPDAGPNIDLTLVIPTEAGLGYVWTVTNNTTWLNFTSTASGGTATRNITVKQSGLPTGMALKVATTATSGGTGKGNRGTGTTTPLTLTTSEENFITDIKTSYTGDGTGNGYQLTYSLAEPTTDADYSLLFFADHVVTVTYTIVGD